jgi:hypothetical protein
MSNDARPASSHYLAEYTAAVARTEALGLATAPRVLVAKDCVNRDQVLSVLLDYFDQHTPEELVGQTLATNLALIPLLLKGTGIPFQLTIGWVVFNGKARFHHGEDTIARFMTEKSRAWRVGEMPFHLWLTSPACEVLDVTFAMNNGWAKNRDECAQMVMYCPAHQPQDNPIYHPTLVGDDFFRHIGMSLEY